MRELIGTAIELGIRYLTIYSFSSENWSRPKDEVFGLMNLFVEVLERELVNLEAMDVRVVVIGELEELPPKTRDAFKRCADRTADNTGMTLVVALNYGPAAWTPPALGKRILGRGPVGPCDVGIWRASGA